MSAMRQRRPCSLQRVRKRARFWAARGEGEASRPPAARGPSACDGGSGRDAGCSTEGIAGGGFYAGTNRVTDDRLQVLGFRAARVAQVDFVVQAHGGNGAVGIEGCQQRVAVCGVGNVVHVARRGDERFHGLDGGGFAVVRSHVHDLGAWPLGEPHQPCAAHVEPRLLRRHLFGGPREHLWRDEVGLPDHRHPVERVLVGDAHAVEPAAPPQAFERGNRVVEVPFRLPVAHFRHLHGEGETVQQPERIGVGAVLLVRVACPRHGDEGHGRHVDERRFRLRQVEVAVFLLEIECHGYLLFVLQVGARDGPGCQAAWEQTMRETARVVKRLGAGERCRQQGQQGTVRAAGDGPGSRGSKGQCRQRAMERRGKTGSKGRERWRRRRKRAPAPRSRSRHPPISRWTFFVSLANTRRYEWSHSSQSRSSGTSPSTSTDIQLRLSE